MYKRYNIIHRAFGVLQAGATPEQPHENDDDVGLTKGKREREKYGSGNWRQLLGRFVIRTDGRSLESETTVVHIAFSSFLLLLFSSRADRGREGGRLLTARTVEDGRREEEGEKKSVCVCVCSRLLSLPPPPPLFIDAQMNSGINRAANNHFLSLSLSLFLLLSLSLSLSLKQQLCVVVVVGG